MMSPRAKKPQPLHTVSQTAEILNASKRTVRRYIERGLLRAVKIGGLVRIDPADLEDLIRDHRSC
jgi:excisionase family DNA binding protein